MVLKTGGKSYGADLNITIKENSPVATDSNYPIGTVWIVAIEEPYRVFMCVDNAPGSASWVDLGGGFGSAHDKGYYDTEAELVAAYPTGEAGDFAFVGETDTFWVWDTDAGAWKDTHTSLSLIWGHIGGDITDQTDLDINAINDADGKKAEWNGKQDNLGFTPENTVNKISSFQATPDDIKFPTEKLVKDSLDGKADITEFNNVWFVSKQGNNDNAGNRPDRSFLTINRAIAEAGVGDLILVTGSEVYEEDLVIGERLYIDANNAILKGTIVIGSCSVVKLNRLIAPGNNATLVKNVGCNGRSYIIANCVLGGGSDIAGAEDNFNNVEIVRNISEEGSLVFKATHVTVAEDGYFIYSIDTGGEIEMTGSSNEWTGSAGSSNPQNVWVNTALSALAQWGTLGGGALVMEDGEPGASDVKFLKYSFVTQQLVTGYSFFAHTNWILNRMPSEFKVYGFKDAAWTLIEHRTGVTYVEGANDFDIPVGSQDTYAEIAFVFLETPDVERVSLARVSLINDNSEVGGSIEYHIERMVLRDNATAIKASSSTCEYNGVIVETRDTGSGTLVDIDDGTVSIMGACADVNTLWNNTGGSLAVSILKRMGGFSGIAELYAKAIREVDPDDSAVVNLVDSLRFGEIRLTDNGDQQVVVPANATEDIPIGSEFVIQGLGTGTKTISSAVGVDINGVTDDFVLDSQYASAVLRKISENAWLIIGAVN